MIIRERLRAVLTIGDTPERIALTFALGLFIGISPLLGLHTVLGLLLAWALGLNRFVMLSGVFVTNPWSIVPIYSFCTWVGMVVLGTEGPVAGIDWSQARMDVMFRQMGSLVLPFIVGTLLVGTASALCGYFVVREAVRRTRSLAAARIARRRAAVSDEKAKEEPEP